MKRYLIASRQDTCFLWNISWWLFLNYEIKLVSIPNTVKLKSTVVMVSYKCGIPNLQYSYSITEMFMFLGCCNLSLCLIETANYLKAIYEFIVVVSSCLVLKSSRFCFISTVHYLNKNILVYYASWVEVQGSHQKS